MRHSLIFGTSVAALAATTPVYVAAAEKSPAAALNAIALAVTSQASTDGPAVNGLVTPVSFDGRSIGAITVAIAGGEVLVSPSDLAELLGDVLAPEVLQRLRELGSAPQLTSTFQAIGLNVSFDFQQLRLFVDLEAQQRGRQEINLRRSVEFDNNLYESSTAQTSGYINITPNLRLDYGGGLGNDLSLGGLIDGAIRIGGADGVTIEGEAFYDQVSDNRLRRGRFRAVKDNPSTQVRLAAGDILPLTTELQGFQPIFGLSIERNFALRPGVITRPFGNSSFLLSRPSQVDILVNGLPTRTLSLTPGPYDLRNLALDDGANNIQIVATDDAGRTEVFNFNQFFDNDLLADGLSEFHFSAGLGSGPDDIVFDFGPDRGLWSGFYRRGLSHTITAGMTSQGDTTGTYQVGGEILWASPIGSFGLETSAAFGDESLDFATTVNFQRRFYLGEALATFDLAATYFGENYRRVGEDDFFGNDQEFFFAAAFAASFDRFALALTANHQTSRVIDDNIRNASAQVSFQVSNRLTANGGVTYSEGNRFNDGFNALVGITYRFGARSLGSARYAGQSDTFSAAFNRSVFERVGEVGYDLRYDQTGSDRRAVQGSLTYIGNRARLIARQRVMQRPGSSFGEEGSTDLSAGVSLAFADGTFAIGRTIPDSFAIVGTDKRIPEADVIVDRDPRTGSYLARSGALGPALVPNLVSYNTRSLTYEVENAPIGYDTGSGLVELLLAFRSGNKTIFGSEVTVVVVGVLLDDLGQPVELRTGTISRVDGEGEASSVFTNRNGRFAANDLRAGEYLIRLTDGREIRFMIEEEDVGLKRLGELRLERVQ